MRIPFLSKSFRKDYKKLKRSGRHDLAKLAAVMQKLTDAEVLGAKHRDHALHGEWKGCRDCHIEGDWVLVYELGIDDGGEETITFHATGSHENLFG